MGIFRGKLGGALFVIVAIACVVFAFRARSRAARFEKEGVSVPGTVVDGEYKRSRRSTTYTVDVRFVETGGVQRREKVKVKKAEWDNIESNGGVGTTVNVRYVPGDSSMVQIGEGTESFGGFMAAAGITGVIGMGILVLGKKS